MKFKSILKITKLEEDEILDKVSILNKQISNLDKIIDIKTSSLNECNNLTSNPADIFTVMLAMKHIDIIRNELDVLYNKKTELNDELSITNKLLIEKKSERKGLEKLIDKQKHEQEKKLAKKEQSFLDELNSL